MMLTQSFFIVGVLCGCCLGASSDVNCRDQASILQAQEQCFSQLGLTLDVEIGQIQNAIQDNPNFVCRNPAAYKSGMSCAMVVAHSCLQEVGHTTDIMPDEERMSQGIDYICSHVQDLDTECIQQTKLPLQQCALAKARAVLSTNRNANVTFITCKSFEITSDCSRDILASCSGQTADIVVHYTTNFATPTICQTGGVGRTGTSSVLLLFIAALLACLRFI